MSKFRHLGHSIVTLMGWGPVAPGEVIDTDLALEHSSNFEKVEDPAPVVEETVAVADEPVVEVKKSKKSEPVEDVQADTEAEA